MSSDGPAVDVGLLSPVTVGFDASVSDTAVLDALVTAEVALVRARGALGLSPAEVADRVSETFGWTGAGEPCRGHAIDASALAAASVAGGNPVIPLVGLLKDAVRGRGARCTEEPRARTSSTRRSCSSPRARRGEVSSSLSETAAALSEFATAHRDQVAAARTLTQHAVPTTVGLRAANWLRGVRRADRPSGCRRPGPARTAGRRRRHARLVRRALRRGCRGRAARRVRRRARTSPPPRRPGTPLAGRSPNWAMRSCRRSTRSA